MLLCTLFLECPPPIEVFNLNMTSDNPGHLNEVRDSFNITKIIRDDFDFQCKESYVLFVSKNGGRDFERATSNSITYECVRDEGSTYNPSIEANGFPKCKLFA